MQDIRDISIELIHPNSWNPNTMNDDEFEALINSIEESRGVYLRDNPIIVRNIEQDFYEIVDGEHRWKAAQKLDYEKIWANVRELTKEEAMHLTVILNKNRGNINYFKLSKLLNVDYEPYTRNNGLTQSDLGQKFGYAQNTISEILQVYPRLESIATAILSQLSNYQLRLLARVKNDSLRELIIKKTPNWKGETLEKNVSKLNSITKYLEEKIPINKEELEEKQINELEKKRQIIIENLINGLGNNIFGFDVESLKREIDSLIKNYEEADLVLFTKLNYAPLPWDVWNYEKDDLYGDIKYDGSIPAGIVFNVLYFYTKPGELVIDPMAGGGVVGDVCKAVNRKCLMFDLKPSHEDIKEHNLKKGWMEEAKNADLVFLDPPYYKKLEEKYGPESISVLDREEYLSFFGKLAYDIRVSGAKRIVLLMSDYTDDEDPSKHIFIWHYVERFVYEGWIPERHIMAPIPVTAVHPDFVVKFRKSRKLGRLGRSLVVFRRYENGEAKVEG